ncbi:isoprenylcysteine carboxylmethyltransferase family protein [Tropicibacter sp. R16_0]|uniref:methyltransferase family protein n=1 Tax=Tropicibacter sp. R16_0 TaxID=2821102 RepID=UPI001AD95D4D|nr:isoprenylcysteine carboxylmethyltransferase family protein [Tropicibacter sp. R16_0]MBO9453294.1 isoprenylcysteine carboxylmethyltransferase family protein [Tropicibacter sp. R16_0]
MPLVIRGLLNVAVQLVVLYAALIGPVRLVSGSWMWARGVELILTYGALVSAATVMLAWLAPKSLEARLTPPFSAAQPTEDFWATVVILIALLASVVFVPMDVFVWQLLPPPAPWVASIGGWIAFAGFALIVWVIFVNQFAILNVEDQSGVGQRVVVSGPYALVRHPMYLSALIMQAGAGLWLGSPASLVMLVPVFLALSVRVIVEERMLLDTLPGYESYCQIRRYRILPLIW